jgi:hypothetical protein
MNRRNSDFSISGDARGGPSWTGLSAGEAEKVETGAGFRQTPWIKRLLAGRLPFRFPVRSGIFGQRRIDDTESDGTSILSRDVLLRLFNIALIAGAFETTADASGPPPQGKPLAVLPTVQPNEALTENVVVPSSRRPTDLPDVALPLKRTEPHGESEPLLSSAPVLLDGSVGGNLSAHRETIRPHPADGNPAAWLPIVGEMVQRAVPSTALVAFPEGVTRHILMGGGGDDVLYATRQNDILKGGSGNDRYVFQPGTGRDVIQEVGGDDTADLSAYHENIVTHLDAGAAALPVVSPSETSTPGIAPGHISTASPWMIHAGFPPVGFFDWAWDSFIQDVIAWSPGQVENILTGAGNDWIQGNAADNRLDAGAGNDRLQGGAGRDTLLGGLGDDVYFFDRGDGQDVVFESGASSDTDVLRFGAGIHLTGITFFQNGDDLQIAYSPTDVITIRNQANAGIERFEFADGSFLSDHDVNQIIQTMAAYAVNQGILLTSLGDVRQAPEMLTLIQSSGQAA